MSDRAKNKAGLAKKNIKILELIENGDCQQLENELSKLSDPVLTIDLRNKFLRAAGLKNIEQLLAAGADEQTIEEHLSVLPPPCPEEREVINEMLKEGLDRQACIQVLRSSGEESPNILGSVALYYLLEPSDAIESVLARVTTAICNMTMDCLERASDAEAPVVRGLELHYATKGALILPALTRALDNHRLRTEQTKTEKLRHNQAGKTSKKVWE